MVVISSWCGHKPAGNISSGSKKFYESNYALEAPCYTGLHLKKEKKRNCVLFPTSLNQSNSIFPYNQKAAFSVQSCECDDNSWYPLKKLYDYCAVDCTEHFPYILQQTFPGAAFFLSVLIKL